MNGRKFHTYKVRLADVNTGQEINREIKSYWDQSWFRDKDELEKEMKVIAEAEQFVADKKQTLYTATHFEAIN